LSAPFRFLIYSKTPKNTKNPKNQNPLDSLLILFYSYLKLNINNKIILLPGLSSRKVTGAYLAFEIVSAHRLLGSSSTFISLSSISPHEI
jgi:hypothetical protein